MEDVCAARLSVAPHTMNPEPAVPHPPLEDERRPLQDTGRGEEERLCSEALFLVSFDFCVIPSGAEGPRIFLDDSRRTPITDQPGCARLALQSAVCVIQSEAKNPGSFLPRPLFYGRGGRPHRGR